MSKTMEIMALHDEAAEDGRLHGAPVYNIVAAKSRKALQEAVDAKLREAYDAGFRHAARWSGDPDLLKDLGAAAFQRERDQFLGCGRGGK